MDSIEPDKKLKTRLTNKNLKHIPDVMYDKI